MQTKIEQVARALYEADDPWASAFPWPAPKEGKPRADEYRRVARAAIEAMRVPTEGMVSVGDDMKYQYADVIYRAMIDAALNEGEG